MGNEELPGAILPPKRRRLLYRIAKTFYDLNLDIASAKIVTEGVRVTDAFYVSDLLRAKISTPERLAKIRGELMKALE